MNYSMIRQNSNFSGIFQQYKNSVYLYALKMLGNKDLAGDVAQDVFMKLLHKQNQNEEIRDVGSWLIVVTRNLCLNTIRDNKKLHSLGAANPVENNSAGPSNEKMACLRRALLVLEPHHREAIILKEYQGYSYAEIAEITGSTVPAVRSILYRARMELREAYQKVKNVGWSK